VPTFPLAAAAAHQSGRPDVPAVASRSSEIRSHQQAGLQKTIGAPGFEPGTSASRTQRSTGLSHAPSENGAGPLASRHSEPVPKDHPELLQRTGWDGPRVARSSRHRPSGGVSARTNPTSPPGTSTADGVGFEPTRQGCCPHALQACALNRSATRPNATNPTSPSRVPSAEGVGFEPTRVFRPNALAGRRLKPLGHPSKTNGPGPALRTRASSCPAWARTRTLLIQSQTCCQLHHGASNQTITNLSFPCTPPRERPWPAEGEPPVGIEPTTPSLRVTCSTI
jgi:hypothetical protein